MSVYNISGASLSTVYNKSGQPLNAVYNRAGANILGETVLKVMTYNVGQWYIGDGNRVPVSKKSDYYTLQHGTFEDEDPVDILFLQEYLNTWCDDDSSAQTEFINPYFDDQEVTNPAGRVGRSICTNGHPILNYQSHNFSHDSGSYPTYQTAQINIDGRTINIINTHNNSDIEYQTWDVTDLLSAVAGMDYFILCGDFNINLSTEDTTSAQYQNSVQRFLDAGYNVGNCVEDWIPTYFGTSSPTGGKYTDQIVTSPNITITELYAYTAKLTDNLGDKIDHLPLVAVLTIA